MNRSHFAHLAGAAALAALLPAGLAAEPWTKVAELPGDIAVELDQASVTHELDGERQVTLGVFRKQMPVALMESSVAVDCQANEAKIRRVRLLNGQDVMSDSILATSTFSPVNEGSAEAIYFGVLCNVGPVPPAAAPAADAAPEATPAAPSGEATGE